MDAGSRWHEVISQSQNWLHQNWTTLIGVYVQEKMFVKIVKNSFLETRETAGEIFFGLRHSNF